MKIKNLLVILPNYIGDVVMSTCALKLLKSNSKNAKLYAITTKEGEKVLEGNNDIDKVITRELRLTWRERFKLVKTVRELSPDTVILFRKTFFNLILGYLSFAKVYIVPDGISRFRQRYIEVVKKIYPKVKLTNDSYRLRIFINHTTLPFELPKEYMVIMPGSSRPAKIWPPEKFSELIKKIKSKYNIQTVLVGAESDLPIAHKIINNMDFEILNLVGKTNIKQLITIIKNTKLFIGHDSAGLYIAEALSIPAIGLFGSTSPQNYGPFPPSVRIIYKKLSCSPCNKNFCPRFKTLPPLCMAQITVKEVQEEIERNFGK